MGKRRPAEDADEIVDARRNGEPTRKIARRLGWSESAVNKILHAAGMNGGVYMTEYDPTPEQCARMCWKHLMDLHRARLEERN
jgi:hypothetical protein